ncbi:hypothetical protein [Myceligenerans pegani]|uniref:ABC transporter permease n=1 Tax=Myceligenerans pegani TaxID=2776917 RepID=A0ABR9MV81_9MICO|nr:hypothetical protein [Myceligenerans sp. TRM 65318]MBE1875297.1 hypothetical protein [Myceligenerans sp. TRM 65318]MBE3017568.1 hypothetical protein [Myceligenerans sp. TRM 65318]
MRLVAKELQRFAVRPAARWVAAGMLVYVVTVVVLAAFTSDGGGLARTVTDGELAGYALVPVLFACVAGALLAAGPNGGTRALLTVEPRRDRVYRLRAVAAALAVLPGVAAAYLLLASGLWGVALVAGPADDPGTTTDAAGLLPALAWSGARVLVLAGCAAVAGAAVGAAVGRWWAAVSVVPVALLGLEVILAGLAAERWSPLAHARAWVAGPAASDAGTSVGPWWLSGLFLLGAVAVVTTVGLLAFRRRELR